MIGGTIVYRDNATSGQKTYTFPGTNYPVAAGSSENIYPSLYPNTTSSKNGNITVYIDSIEFDFDTSSPSYSYPDKVHFVYDDFDSGTDTIYMTWTGNGAFVHNESFSVGTVSSGKYFAIPGHMSIYLETD